MKPFAMLLASLLLPVGVFAQVPATGRILVATPAIDDVAFERTVVLLIHHSDEGSLGLFLNRPTWVDGADAFAELEPFDRRSRTLALGGPIAMTRLLALIANEEDIAGLTEVGYGIFLTADVAALASPDGLPAGSVRIFAGHTAWAPGQLQEEVDDGYWRIIESTPALVFDTDPATLWELATDLASSGLTAGIAGAR